jgi:antitoxin CcdA
VKQRYNVEARKRAVNLTLNEDLVAQARNLTDNLSEVVESLLADFVEQQHRKRVSEARIAEQTAAVWNEFNVRHGSFADEYSSL